VDEPFGPLVREWRDGSPGKERRLEVLLEQLSISEQEAMPLRYQLFHRTVAALIEAQRYKADVAMMLVHSFHQDHACFEDFRNFTHGLGALVDEPGDGSEPMERMGTMLRLAWVADKVRR